MQRISIACKAIGIGLIFSCRLDSYASASELSAKIDPNKSGDQTICQQLALPLDSSLSGQSTALLPELANCGGSYQAQAQPPTERFPQPLPDLNPVPPGQEPVAPSLEPEPPPEEVPAEEVPTEVFVESIQVTGSTVFDQADLAAVLSPFEGRSLTPEQLAQAVEAVTQLYVAQGYITSRATLPEQVIADGSVEIEVIEGELETIVVEGNQNLGDRYIRDRIALAAGKPLNQIALEEQLRLLQLDPAIETVEASLQPGSGIGQNVLNVRVQESNPLVAQFSFDNFSPDSVGSERLGAEVSYLSPLGIGDQVFASAYISTTGGSEVYEIGYRVPLNALNGTLQLRFVPSSFEITDSSANFGLDIKGDADVYDVSFRQPLIRSLREELALSLGFRRREGQTLISDIVFDSSRTSILQFGQDYLRRDATGAWALRSQFNIGTDLFGVTQRSGDQPDGDFLSWVGQVQRIEILNDRHTLIVQGDLQLSGDPLLPSEQFIVGGGQSLRGYEQNSLFGDSGFRLSIEDRITLEANALGQPRLQVAPFLDMGAVWNNESGQTGRNEDFLVGLGTGLIWQPLPGLNMRLDLAVPLVSDGNEQGFFFNITYRP